MQPDSDDDAWRSIVENYGERVDPEPAGDEATSFEEEPAEPVEWDDESFVPPPPPPLPRSTPDRVTAWSGLFGSPSILLLALVLGISLPVWFGYLLVAWFIGGFVYLVALMPRGPRDPGDDGARI